MQATGLVTPMPEGARKIYDERKDAISKRTDLLFTTLIVFEWLAAMLVAMIVSPLAWEGRNSYIHPHLFVAVIFGGLITLPVVYLYITAAGKPITRHFIAFSQMLISAILIHLTGGRIETHFHIFGSLAFLAFYRDWRVFITATIVVTLDHLIRGIYVPESVYGVMTASPWRTVEHAGWVLFECVFLARVCKQDEQEMQSLAIQQDAIEETNSRIQELAELRAKELEQSKGLLAAIVDHSFDAIIGIDKDLNVTSWNTGAESLYGYEETYAIGKNIQFLVPKERQRAFQKLVKKVFQGNPAKEMETVRLKSDGSLLEVALTASPIKSDNDTIIGCSLIERDITARKEVEKRISAFYSTVSHELRTPLTSIRGALCILDDEIVNLDSEEGKEMVQLARNSSERLVRLINDILDLRKIEEDKLELNLTETDTNSLVKQGIDTMSGMAASAGVTLASKLDLNATVNVDKDRITQVLANLLSNAIKYSENGDTVMVSVDSSKAGYIRFSVTDQGEGIDNSKLDKLFGKFQQIDSSDSRPKEGTGLGLSISKAIIEEHKGKIGVHSRPKIGSTFWFELPYEKTSIQSVDILKGLNGNNTSPSLLIIEDDLNLAQLLKLCLNKRGLNSKHATTIKQASKILEDMTPSIIILDVLLPDGDGLTYLEKIKSDPGLKQVPVIVISGKNRDDFEFAHPFVYDWYQKPFDLEDLTRSVCLLLNGKRKVLVIEDDDNTRAVITKQLKLLDAICIEASTGELAVSLAKKTKPDVIILDVNLPKMSGFEVVEALSGMPPPALLVYSGLELSKEEKNLLNLGITEHLTKGRISPERFVSTVEELIKRVARQTHLPQNPSREEGITRKGEKSPERVKNHPKE